MLAEGHKGQRMDEVGRGLSEESPAEFLGGWAGGGGVGG